MLLDPLSALIDKIYDSALEPSSWPETLTLASNYIGASFMSIVPYSDPSAIYMSRGGDHALKSYKEHWFAYDTMVKIGIAHKHTSDLICDWAVLGAEKIGKDSYYQEYRRDCGIGYCLGSTFEAYPGDHRALGINLPLGRKPLSQSDLVSTHKILRHIARAATISSRILSSRSDTINLKAVLDRFQAGAAIIDDAGYIKAANTAIRYAIGDGLTITSNKLQCARTSCQRGLELLIRNALSKTSGSEDAHFSFILRPSGRRPLVARAISLSNQSTEQIWARLPATKQVLVIIVDLDSQLKITCERALHSMGATPAEAKVAALVGHGLSPRQCAAHLNVRESTVRSQLKQVFLKLELSRQSELVRFISQLEQGV